MFSFKSISIDWQKCGFYLKISTTKLPLATKHLVA